MIAKVVLSGLGTLHLVSLMVTSYIIKVLYQNLETDNRTMCV